MPVVPPAVPSAAVAPAVVGGPPDRDPGAVRRRLGSDTTSTRESDARRERWRSAYAARLAELLRTPASSPADSARRLSELVRSNLLSFEDLRSDPSKFFEAHRLLVNHGFEQGPGFSIRFTVQFNLFAGTVLELGNPAQLRELREMQRLGVLGCFALTERLAGVNSGLVVETKCEWLPETRAFRLWTPREGARKNWISQGLTASKAVVMADLIVAGGKSVGPHAFLVDLRDPATGAVRAGISLEDMGEKTTGNDLDNAAIAFDDVALPRSALLDRHCVLDPDGRYAPKTPDAPSNMELIGQRLFTGRVAVAQGAHEFRRRLFRRTRAATDAKPCWAPRDAASAGEGAPRPLMLSAVPQLRALYAEADAREARVGAFLRAVEAKLCGVLEGGARPDAALVEAVAAAKIIAVDEAIEFCHRLRQEVGSYALQAGTGFEHTDFLQCCKFAEGDSRVLMMKVARDRVKWFAGLEARGRPAPAWLAGREAEALAKLARRIEREKRAGRGGAAAWEAAWEEAYALAAVAVDAIVDRWVGGVEKFRGTNTSRSVPASRL